MSFNIIEYIDCLKDRMYAFDLTNKIAFSAWCTEGLLNQNFNFIVANVGVKNTKKIQKILDDMWNYCVNKNNLLNKDLVNKWMKECAALLNESGVNWEDDDLSPEDSYKHFSTVKFFECLLITLETYLVDNSELPATAAEMYITSLDFNLCMVLGIKKPFETQEMKLEINYQKQMIQYLELSNIKLDDYRFYIRPQNISYKEKTEGSDPDVLFKE